MGLASELARAQPLATPRICCLDLDTFFVSVGRLLEPTLEGKPVIPRTTVGSISNERTFREDVTDLASIEAVCAVSATGLLGADASGTSRTVTLGALFRPGLESRVL
jgi:hypothetical protein